MVPLCALVVMCILCVKVQFGERHAVIGKEQCKAWTAAEASLRVQKQSGAISGQKQIQMRVYEFQGRRKANKNLCLQPFILPMF